MISKTLVKCDGCGKSFERSISEVNRNKKLGRKIYCSLACSGRAMVLMNDVRRMWRPENLQSNNRKDEYSPFRLLFRTAKRHAKERGRPFELTLEYIKNLWICQKGICPYTGWELVLPLTSKNKTPLTPRKASLDRKDSSKGYICGNVQFVSYMANVAKSFFKDSELIAFCEAVTNNKREI